MPVVSPAAPWLTVPTMAWLTLQHSQRSLDRFDYTTGVIVV